MAVPRHFSTPAASVQPVIPAHAQLAEAPEQSAHATVGVPVHVGWFAAARLAAMIAPSPGTPTTADLQQSWLGHWLLSVHSLGQAVLQAPPQHASPPAASHSASLVQTAGHGIMLSRHNPDTDMPADAPAMVVQQASPAAVSHSALVAHGVMQVPAGTQIGTV